MVLYSLLLMLSEVWNKTLRKCWGMLETNVVFDIMHYLCGVLRMVFVEHASFICDAAKIS